DKPSIADIANYSYVAHAPEGNVSLEAYPNIRAWLARIAALPGFVPVPRTAAGLQARYTVAAGLTGSTSEGGRSVHQLPSHRQSPWHAGEKQLQEKVGVAERMEVLGQKVIRDYMPDQHREFYRQLPFMIAAAVDGAGQPWATLIEGEQGFVTSPDPRQLSFDLSAMALDPLDPASSGLGAGEAIGLLG